MDNSFCIQPSPCCSFITQMNKGPATAQISSVKVNSRIARGGPQSMPVNRRNFNQASRWMTVDGLVLILCQAPVIRETLNGCLRWRGQVKEHQRVKKKITWRINHVWEIKLGFLHDIGPSKVVDLLFGFLELVWEAFLRYLESSFLMFVVDCSKNTITTCLKIWRVPWVR